MHVHEEKLPTFWRWRQHFVYKWGRLFAFMTRNWILKAAFVRQWTKFWPGVSNSVKYQNFAVRPKKKIVMFPISDRPSQNLADSKIFMWSEKKIYICPTCLSSHKPIPGIAKLSDVWPLLSVNLWIKPSCILYLDVSEALTLSTVGSSEIWRRLPLSSFVFCCATCDLLS